MIELLFQIALSNVGISFALAIVAVVVGKTLKRPALTHLLWLLVFVKLLTPSIVTIPVVPIPWQTDPSPAAIFAFDEQQDAAAVQVAGSEKAAFFSADNWSVVLNHVKPWLFLSWMLGSLFVFAWSLLRVFRFRRLLGKVLELGATELQAAATKIGSRLGLRAFPTIYTTLAHLSPMVWWARHHLRANEEICCDDLVLSSLNPKPHTYADSILNAIEYLASPVIRPPSMASEINSGRLLKML